MFSDLFEHLRDYWRSTGKPALQNLVSEKKSMVSLFAVLFLTEALLGMLFFSYANNRETQEELQHECDFISWTPGAEEDEALTAAVDDLNAKIQSMATMNTALFVFSAVIWAALSAFILSRLISSSVELKKMTYGLYIVFGADTKKIRRLIFLQMMTLGIAAMPPAMLVATQSVQHIYGFLPRGNIWLRDLFFTVAAMAVLLILVIGGIALHTTSGTCVSMLTASDVSNTVKAPRLSRSLYANQPFRHAGLAVWRMRRYYLPLILAAALPACIIFTCMSMVRSNDRRKEGTVTEYTYLFSEGFSRSWLENNFRPTLKTVGGVAEVSASGSGFADDFGIHMLIEEKDISDPAVFLPCHGGSAVDSVKLLSADPYTLGAHNLEVQRNSSPIQTEVPAFVITPPQEGHAVMLYPRTVAGQWPELYEPVYTPASSLFIPYPQEEMIPLSLEEKLACSDRAGMTLLLNPAITVNDDILFDKVRNETHFFNHRITEEYLLLNPVDFKKLTGIDSANNAWQGLPTDPVPLSEVGGYVSATLAKQNPELTSAAQPHLYAHNQFHALVADPTMFDAYGLPADTVLPTEPGTVTLVLGALSPINDDIDRLLLSGTNTIPYDTHTIDYYTRTNLDRIHIALTLASQTYTSYRVCQVVRSDRVTDDILLMAEQDLAYLFRRPGAYTDLYVSVDANLTPRELCGLVSLLTRWEKMTAVNNRYPERQEAGILWDAFLMQHCRYNEMLCMISLLLLLAIPFIWFCPQYNHFKKRKRDLETLLALGFPPRRIFGTVAAEGCVLALATTALTLVLCPLFALAVFLFIRFNGLPFAYSTFDFSTLLIVLAVSALCAIATVLLNFLFLFPMRKKTNWKPTADEEFSSPPDTDLTM